MAGIDDVLLTDIAFTGDFVASPTGDLDKISGLANLKQALFRRLITVPGSLIHRPTYGVGIQEFQNAPSSLSVKRQLANRIGSQFPQDPRVTKVKGVRIDSDDLTPEKTVLTVTCDVRGYGEVDLAFTPFAEVTV